MRPAAAAVALLCGLALLAPAAAERGAVELTGRFPLELGGRGVAKALDAAALVQGNGGNLALALDGLEVGALHVVYRMAGASQGPPGDPLLAQEEATQDALDLGGATLRLASRGPAFQMLLFGAAAQLSSNGTGGAQALTVRALPEPVQVATGPAFVPVVAMGKGGSAAESRFAHTLAAGLYDVRLAAGTLAADGPFSLYLAGCEVVLEAPGQPARTLRLREERREAPGSLYQPATGTWAGPGTHTEVVQEYLVVHAQRAHFEAVVTGLTVSLLAGGLALEGSGPLRVPGARGTLFVRDGDSATMFSPYAPAGEDLLLEGTFALALRKQPGDLGTTALSGSGDLAAIAYGQVAARFPAGLAAATGVGALLAVAAAWLAWKANLAGVLVAGYARVHGERLLRHPSRAAIYGCIQATPGLALPQVAARCALTVSTARHHLRALEAAGYVLAARDGRALRLFDGRSPLYQGPRRRLLTVLRNANTRAIAHHIRGHPGAAQQDLVARFALSQSAVKWHVSRLAAANLVEARRDPPFVRYFPAAAWSHLPEGAEPPPPAPSTA